MDARPDTPHRVRRRPKSPHGYTARALCRWRSRTLQREQSDRRMPSTARLLNCFAGRILEVQLLWTGAALQTCGFSFRFPPGEHRPLSAAGLSVIALETYSF